MIDKILVTVFSIVIGITIFMQLMLLSLPYLKKIEFDAVCHRYVMTMSYNGGLNPDDHQAFIDNLEHKGFDIRSLHGDNDAIYGSIMSMEVDAVFTTYRFSHLFRLEEVDLCFTYSAEIPARILAKQ